MSERPKVDPHREPHWPPPPIDQRRLTVTFEQPLDPGYPEHRWVYLWHWPIRTMHWVAALCVVILFVTGFSIGRPYFLGTSPQPSFVTQWVRLTHFVAAGVLIATAIVRAYWLLAGNRFERFPALFPVRGRDWGNLVRMMKYYLLIHPERTPRYLGHNPLQQVFYTLTYGVAALMAITGFILIGQANPGGVFMHTFGRLTPLFGGLQMVRVIHHVAAWYFPLFIIMHVYLSLRADLLERSGTVSSMIGGGRFVPIEEEYVDG